MRRLILLSLTLLFAVVLARPAQAFTPENGFYWNADEPGRGYTIEIQDNFLFLIVYVYNPDGSATWFTSQGLMQGNTLFNGTLDATTGGPCIGCPFTEGTTVVNAAGPITLEFNTEISATLTWSAGSFQIDRFDYYLTRGAADTATELMLGEWQIVLDYANVPQVGGFFGDVVIYNSFDTSEDPDFFDGCRADDSILGRCSQQALNNNAATGFYDSTQDLHFLVVANSANDDVLYVVRTGTGQFDGFAKVCPNNASLDNCLQDTNNAQIPVRGFRTASRSFVQDGVGPNRAIGATKAGLPLAPSNGQKQIGMSDAEVMSRYGIDVKALPIAKIERAAQRVQ